MKPGFIKQIFFSGFFIIFGLGVLGLLGLGVTRNYLKRQQINREVSTLQAEIDSLHQGNEELTSMIDYLQTSNFIEEQAKTKFGLAREGESVLIVPPPLKEKANYSPNDASGKPLAQDLPNQLRWWYYFWSH